MDDYFRFLFYLFVANSLCAVWWSAMASSVMHLTEMGRATLTQSMWLRHEINLCDRLIAPIWFARYFLLSIPLAVFLLIVRFFPESLTKLFIVSKFTNPEVPKARSL